MTSLLERTAGPDAPARRRVGLERLGGPVTRWALAAVALAGIGQSLGAVVAGRLAEQPRVGLVGILALCLVGGALLDTVARAAWAGVVHRAEGRLRADLLDAALHQPLSVLSEQAVGEVLDRVDDDTSEIGRLLRRTGWDVVRTSLRLGPIWVVAGLTWWPSWVLLPLVAAGTVALVRPLSGEIARRKVAEEVARTDAVAALEEGIAARDDLRTSLGQAHVVRRAAELSAVVHLRVAATSAMAAKVGRRTGLLLHGLLATAVVVGTASVVDGSGSTADLVTLFLATSTFVGQVDQVARHLPELQAGLGALTRVRQLLEAEPEPVGGQPVPGGSLEIVFRDLRFSYPSGGFALRDVDLVVPAGHTLALVGRTGSGKTTLASLLSRAVEPPRGTVLLGGVDVRDLDLQALRQAVGVVTQRTELVSASVADNITLFADVPRAAVEAAVAELGLQEWVAGLPDGLATVIGPGGTPLSAGEEQLVAFARLLVRDVRVVVLDEATARMDPQTERLVVAAADRLLQGRTGLLIAHRIATTERADAIAVLDGGRVVQAGPRSRLAAEEGPLRVLLEAAGHAGQDGADAGRSVGSARRVGAPPSLPPVPPVAGLARQTTAALLAHPRWGLLGGLLFLLTSLLGAYGSVTGYLWGRVVTDVEAGGRPVVAVGLLVASLLAAPLVLSEAFRVYFRWWVALLLRVRLSVLRGQTRTHRLARTPPGEVVARALDAERFVIYADRWVDLVTGLALVVTTTVAALDLRAGGLLLAVIVGSAAVSSLGASAAGRTADRASIARAVFGRSLSSALESARTVKLAAATPAVHRHLAAVDQGRVDASVREQRLQAVLDGVPVVLVQSAVVTGWLMLALGAWDLATTLLVTTAVAGFEWFGRVAGAVVTEAPGTRAWLSATSALAGGPLVPVPHGVDLVRGTAPLPEPGDREALTTLELRGLTAVHEDGTLGVVDVDLDVRGGDLVLLLGPVGSGKSSLLGALAGLVETTGTLRWNGAEVTDPQALLRPARVAHVAQVPRVLSGTLGSNVVLDHADRDARTALDDARLGRDVADLGGVDAVVGTRGVRLSGGQVQRLALARALATGAELLLADDVSSALDATTEVELWESLRRRGTTVLGSTSKRAALARADLVVVLSEGRVVDTGPWSQLSERWGALAG